MLVEEFSKMRSLPVLALVLAALQIFGGLSFSCHPTDRLVEKAKLRIATLESELHQVEENVDKRNQYIAKCESTIQEIDENIKELRFALYDAENENLETDRQMVSALEEEKRTLWEELRKNNFDLHVLRIRVQEAESRLNSSQSQVEKMADVVTEQWIQIRNFEQALQNLQKSLQKDRQQATAFLYTVLEFVDKAFDRNILETLRRLSSTMRSNLVNSWYTLDAKFLMVKRFHHGLQGKIKEHMEKHVITSHFANHEVVFWVASAIIVFPILGPCICLSSR